MPPLGSAGGHGRRRPTFRVLILDDARRAWTKLAACPAADLDKGTVRCISLIQVPLLVSYLPFSAPAKLARGGQPRVKSGPSDPTLVRAVLAFQHRNRNLFNMRNLRDRHGPWRGE